MNRKVKTDLRYEFEEVIIPALRLRLEQEENLTDYLKLLSGQGFEAPMDRAIDLAMDSARMYRQRISECKKYVSELKN